MEPGNQSAEHAPLPQQPEAVRYEPRPLEYGERQAARQERIGSIVSAAERLPSAVEQQAQPPSTAIPTVLPVPQADDAQSLVSTQPSDDVPLVAADEDVIEREWVDKAKKILTETKDDPFRREQEVKRLQIEYVRKRYGREIGDPGD